MSLGAIVVSSHGEQCLIPEHARDYEVFGVIRDPIERLHSLYYYIKQMKGFGASYLNPLQKEAKLDFRSWLMEGTVPFTQPFLDGQFIPRYNVAFCMPEQHKNYANYFLPNINLVSVNNLTDHFAELGVDLGSYQNSVKHDNITYPELSLEDSDIREKYAKDFELFRRSE